MTMTASVIMHMQPVDLGDYSSKHSLLTHAVYLSGAGCFQKFCYSLVCVKILLKVININRLKNLKSTVLSVQVLLPPFCRQGYGLDNFCKSYCCLAPALWVLHGHLMCPIIELNIMHSVIITVIYYTCACCLNDGDSKCQRNTVTNTHHVNFSTI